MLKSKNSNNINLNTQPKFSALCDKNKHFHGCISQYKLSYAVVTSNPRSQWLTTTKVYY